MTATTLRPTLLRPAALGATLLLAACGGGEVETATPVVIAPPPIFAKDGRAISQPVVVNGQTPCSQLLAEPAPEGLLGCPG